MIEDLKKHAEDYKATGSPDALAKLYELLEQDTLTFTVYFNNPNETGRCRLRAIIFRALFRNLLNPWIIRRLIC